MKSLANNRMVLENISLIIKLVLLLLKQFDSLVGSPDYMAVEILEGKGYDQCVDYWALGCIIFEFLCGYPPFTGAAIEDVWFNVTHWKKTLVRPIYTGVDAEFNVSDTAWDIISKLICDAEVRLGKKRIEDIQEHMFFKGLKFDRLLQMVPTTSN